jgi:hypothetical protein
VPRRLRTAIRAVGISCATTAADLRWCEKMSPSTPASAAPDPLRPCENRCRIFALTWLLRLCRPARIDRDMRAAEGRELIRL